MKFTIKKEDLFEGIRTVNGVAVMKGLQPVLANILIETTEKSTIRLTATDLDLSIITEVEAQIESEGQITLPAKKLSDIVAKLQNDLIVFELNEDSNVMNIKCHKTKFDIIGISSKEFPSIMENVKLDEENSIEIDMTPFNRAIEHAGFAAASYETSNLLSGVVCDISENILEMASTDGNRLARVREKINSNNGKSRQLIIPSKTLKEFLKISSASSESLVKIYTDRAKLIFKTENTLMISKLMEGQYPKYNQLIPQTSPKEAVVNKSEFINAIETVAVMVNDKTSIVKLELSGDKLKLTGDTPDAGASEVVIDMKYDNEDLIIAFNYRYLLDALKYIDDEEVKIGLNTNTSATIFTPNGEEDYISLIMPVQIR